MAYTNTRFPAARQWELALGNDDYLHMILLVGWPRRWPPRRAASFAKRCGEPRGPARLTGSCPDSNETINNFVGGIFNEGRLVVRNHTC